MNKDKICFDVLTLFPEFFNDPLSTSLISRAIKKGLIDIKTHSVRDFGVGKHKQVDDRPFGGGPGMVLKPDVLANSLDGVIRNRKEHGTKLKPYVILLDPAGNLFNQEKARKLTKRKWTILVCGHYEGVDERFKQRMVDEEISVGDFVLTGGEPAALILIDAISRLIPGVLGKSESVEQESFGKIRVGKKELKLLDYPVYTHPKNFLGKKVPTVLLSGNHEEIKRWRSEKALSKTKRKRPDLMK
jgi:tRNA (guanine37-N1)-methyltransferase